MGIVSTGVPIHDCKPPRLSISPKMRAELARGTYRKPFTVHGVKAEDGGSVRVYPGAEWKCEYPQCTGMANLSSKGEWTLKVPPKVDAKDAPSNGHVTNDRKVLTEQKTS